MTARAIMIQGTASDVGKSVIVAGLCRSARRRGLSVAPFKPQNMSNNAAACADGGEIGRAQALQAMACGLPPEVDFNPVLLKPQTDRMAQVVVRGRVVAAQSAADYMAGRDTLLDEVLGSFDRLSARHDLVIVEGAGSPAEINLRARDIANMGFARAAGLPVCLLGDVDRGGVIASLVGTKAVIDEADAAMITSFAVNKFRGDPQLFEDGVREIEARTGWPCLGVIPWLSATAGLPAEDAVALEHPRRRNDGAIKIAAPMFSRIANFDDADPLRAEPSVDFRFIPPGQAIPRDCDVVILFGTKSTVGDLVFMREQGWDHDILAHVRAGGRVLGICGGFQMLGGLLRDPNGVDGPAGEVEGLGLLDVQTEMMADKCVRPVEGRCAQTNLAVRGYEIHAGRTIGSDLDRPMIRLADRLDGARSADGKVEGTYLHGLFAADDFRRAWLNRIRPGATTETIDYDAGVDRALDELADGLEAALDVERLFDMAREPGWAPTAG